MLAHMDVLVLVRSFTDAESLARRIRRWEALGVAGVFISDHLFVSDRRGITPVSEQPDPVVVLAAIGALSPTLMMGTLVANVSFAHPALTLRHFAQLAALFGGGRVLMGLGAGWNGEEYSALGLTMPGHADRIRRLDQALRLGRALFSDGVATIEAPGLIARDLRLSPRPEVAPRFLVGGGSDRLLRLAGAFADWVDLNGSSRRVKIGRTSPAVKDAVRRLTTTVSDLEESVRRLADSANGAGRSVSDIRRSVLIDTIEFCPVSEVGERESRLRLARQAPETDAQQCPYVLIGPPARMRDLLAERCERLGLSAVIIQDNDNLKPFMKEVANLCGKPAGQQWAAVAYSSICMVPGPGPRTAGEQDHMLPWSARPCGWRRAHHHFRP
jgi:alkanesulfonate monooxygenase SsuD/methylene tetrahydromethanopterin reductase-like flavin-dependent oxidoreductase (luciferase family)